VISITVDNTTIEATAYHPFWVIEGRDLQERSKPRELQEHEDEGHSLPGRWVNSHELRAGDCIITRSGTRVLITEIRQRFDDAFPVSNLSIIGHHNYAVGDVGVLVHNKSVCDETIAELREAHANGKGKSKAEIREWLRSQQANGKRIYSDKDIDDAMGKILAKNSADDLVDDNIESTAMLRKLHPDDPEVLDNALVKGKRSGSYINRHKSGKPYVGKGLPSRAAQSAKDVAERTGDPHVSTEWESAIDDIQALIDEARKIRQLGGIENLHNRRNSPGENL